MIRRLAFAGLLLLAPIAALASQSTLVTPVVGPMSMGTYAGTYLNPALASLASMSSGTTAPTNGPGGAPIAFQPWADTSTTPATVRQYDGAQWVAIGTLNMTTHVYTPMLPAFAGTDCSIVTNSYTVNCAGFLVSPHSFTGQQSFVADASPLKLIASQTAQGQQPDATFWATFVGQADNGARRTADIWGWFNNGAWGAETLSLGVGTGGSSPNDVGNRGTEVLRLTSNNGSQFFGTVSAVAPAASDSSTKVPTTAWVRAITSGVTNGYRNRIINGGDQIDQRNNGAAQTITAGAALAYTDDHWFAYATGANVVGQRVAGSVSGAQTARYRYQFTGATGVTAITRCQRVEVAYSYDLASNYAVISADLADSLLTTVNVTVSAANSADTFGTIASPTTTSLGSVALTVSTTLTRYSVYLTVPSTVVGGIQVCFGVGAQTSGTFTLGNAMLEPGTTATPFEQRDVVTELSRAQRYFVVFGGNDPYEYFGSVSYTSATAFNVMLKLPVRMRVVPTFTPAAAANFSTFTSAGSKAVTSLTLDHATFDTVGILGAGTGTLGVAGVMQGNNTTAATISVSAEL